MAGAPPARAAAVAELIGGHLARGILETTGVVAAAAAEAGDGPAPLCAVDMAH